MIIAERRLASVSSSFGEEALAFDVRKRYYLSSGFMHENA